MRWPAEGDAQVENPVDGGSASAERGDHEWGPTGNYYVRRRRCGFALDAQE